MSKIFTPSKERGFLFRGEYRVNREYAQYDYDHLDALVKWWGYLNHKSYRYTYLVFSLRYDDQVSHSPTNITKFLNHIRKRFKVKGQLVPLHSAWRLEYRLLPSKDGVVGYHYHVFLCFNRDISPSTTKLTELVHKYWQHGTVFVTCTHLSPETVDTYYSGQMLSCPIRNTQTEHPCGIFHHLSYLAKKDPNQVLPNDYTGDAFKTSQHLESRLVGHPSIEKHNNTTRFEKPLFGLDDVKIHDGFKLTDAFQIEVSL